jgi:hypothetical protein
MVIYRNIRNKFAHKKKWNQEEKNRKNQNKYQAALECIDVAMAYFTIAEKELLISALRKCANYLYN